MDTTNYIGLLKECNKYKNIIMNLPKAEYKTVYGENIQSIFFKGNFYSKQEYDEIQKQENNTVKRRIAEINQSIEHMTKNNL